MTTRNVRRYRRIARECSVSIAVALMLWTLMLLSCMTALALSGCSGDDDHIVSISDAAPPDAEPADARAPSPNGGPCEVDADCESGLCLLQLGNGAIVFTGGMCTTMCSLQQGLLCEPGEICLEYVPTGDKHCYQVCGPGAPDCRPDYICRTVSAVDPVCLP